MHPIAVLDKNRKVLRILGWIIRSSFLGETSTVEQILEAIQIGIPIHNCY
jgi:hypothetical protein